MSSPTSSLLQHLLTRSDLERLDVAPPQVDAWLANRALEPIAQLPAAQAAAEGEQVFSVPDATLRDDLGARLTAIGKPTALLCPLRIRSFLQRTARGVSPADAAAADPAAAVAEELPDGDLAEMLATAIRAIDGDIEVVLRLAEQAPATDVARTAAVTGTRDHEGDDVTEAHVTEESLLLDDPIAPGGNSESEWFDTSELAAAMGDLAPDPAAAIEPAAIAEPTTSTASPAFAKPTEAVATIEAIDAQVPPTAAAADDETVPVPDAALTALVASLEAQAAELGALTQMVATHGELLRRLDGMQGAIESLHQQVAELRATAVLAAAAVPPAPVAPPAQERAPAPPPAPVATPVTALEAPAAAAPTTATCPHAVVDHRRTSLMATGLALMCWSGLIWFGTGSATLALVSFVAANVVGCLALRPTGDRAG